MLERVPRRVSSVARSSCVRTVTTPGRSEGDGFGGVQQQVHDDLVDLRGVGLDGGYGGFEFEVQADVAGKGGAHNAADLQDGGRDTDGVQDKPAFTGVGQELARQIGGPFARLHQALQEGTQRAGGRRKVEAEAGVSHNAGEEIIEVMGDAAGQYSEAFQLLRFTKLLFNLFALGDIFDNSEKIVPFVALAQNGGIQIGPHHLA